MQTAIVPVPVFPATANTLQIRGVGPVDDSGRPNYFWELSDTTETAPAVAATDTAAEIPAVFSVVARLSGNASMTVEQWHAWGRAAQDEEYQLNALAAVLGLVRA
jgi:hypothetical protein